MFATVARRLRNGHDRPRRPRRHARRRPRRPTTTTSTGTTPRRPTTTGTTTDDHAVRHAGHDHLRRLEPRHHRLDDNLERLDARRLRGRISVDHGRHHRTSVRPRSRPAPAKSTRTGTNSSAPDAAHGALPDVYFTDSDRNDVITNNWAL
ncbi:MAG: hypothetical protein MZU97_00395 [Bacillus subtilis]|nr:hypothetical protein [Bacillus subtilis]